jgi:glutaredoxin-related protein
MFATLWLLFLLFPLFLRSICSLFWALKTQMIDLATMDKADRDPLWEKSGGDRTIPLVFIDGEYKGSYDVMQDLEEVDELKDLIL